jgi:hypothetical protein
MQFVHADGLLDSEEGHCFCSFRAEQRMQVGHFAAIFLLVTVFQTLKEHFRLGNKTLCYHAGTGDSFDRGGVGHLVPVAAHLFFYLFHGMEENVLVARVLLVVRQHEKVVNLASNIPLGTGGS